MAQVIVPNMPAKDDALTTLMKGLQIAGNIYGIRTNMAQLDEFQKKQQHEQDLAAGKYNKDEQVKLAEKFDVSPEAPQGRSAQVSDLETGSPLYVSLKRETSPILRDIKGVKDGQSGTFVKDYRVGKEVDFIPDAGPALEKVQTTDENGNPVVRFVTPKAGASYASAPKAASGDREYAKLPKPAQEQVSKLADKIAAKTDIANMMDSELANFKKAYENGDKTQAIKAGEGMYKLLNSAVSTDAVSKDEADRIGSLLQYQMFNLTGAGPAFGRDLGGFYEQVSSKANALKESALANQKRIDDIYSGKYGAEFAPKQAPLGKFGASAPNPDEAIAGPVKSAGPSAADQKALKFLKDFPNHPDAPSVRATLKMKGF